MFGLVFRPVWSGLQTSPARLVLMLGGPVAIAVACWVYLAIMIGDMSTIPGMSSQMMHPEKFDLVQLFGLFVMWAVMMAAMMLPGAMPMIMAYSRMQATERKQGANWIPVFAFSGGYVLAWVAFSLGAAVLGGVII